MKLLDATKIGLHICGKSVILFYGKVLIGYAKAKNVGKFGLTKGGRAHGPGNKRPQTI